MRKLLISIMMVMLLAGTLHAGDSGRMPVFRTGVEWGYNLSFWHFYHFNYLSDVGARVDSQDNHFTNYSNGMACAYAGVLLSPSWELDIVSGYLGIWKGRTVVPINMRLVKYLSSYDTDGGFKLFIDGGPIIGRAKGDSIAWMMKQGFGRRVMLSDRLSMDLMLSLQESYDHPGGSVFDPGHGIYIPEGNALRSNAAYCAVCLSIALNL